MRRPLFRGHEDADGREFTGSLRHRADCSARACCAFRLRDWARRLPLPEAPFLQRGFPPFSFRRRGFFCFRRSGAPFPCFLPERRSFCGLCGSKRYGADKNRAEPRKAPPGRFRNRTENSSCTKGNSRDYSSRRAGRFFGRRRYSAGTSGSPAVRLSPCARCCCKRSGAVRRNSPSPPKSFRSPACQFTVTSNSTFTSSPSARSGREKPVWGLYAG